MPEPTEDRSEFRNGPERCDVPEFRKDSIVDRWVIIARHRAERPHELVESTPQRPAGSICPFCEGHEEQTTQEILAVRTPGTRPNTPGWNVRVVPNKYPAVLPSIGEANAGEAVPPAAGFYRSQPGFGAHEVIIESPRHVVSTTDESVETLTEVLWIYRQRLIELRCDSRLKYGLIFKNVGAAAGASIEHTHSQLVAMPLVPTSVAEKLSAGENFYRANRRCIYCQLLADELSLGQRIVFESPGFVAFCPYAPRFPFETWIVPRAHASHYETLAEGGAAELALVLRTVVAKIEVALARPAYNYIIHTGSFDTFGVEHYHWHIEIIPRVTKTAGFEWGTGFFINPMPPEEAAGVLRACDTMS